MRVTPLVPLFALSISFSAFAGPLSRPAPAPKRPLNLDVSGAYGPSPAAIIFRDAAFGAFGGAMLGPTAGAASDSGHRGRDAVIGAGIGLILGAIVGGFETLAEPRISIRSDVDRLQEGTPAMRSSLMRLGQHF